MNFGLSGEQVQFKETIRRFLAERCPSPRIRAIMDGSTGHDRDLWQAFADLGACGLNVVPEFDGAGLDLLDVALVAEELGYAATPVPFLGHAMAVVALNEGEDERVRAEWLPHLARGERIGCVAFGEADGEWRPMHFACQASEQTISGHKPLVAGAVGAGCFVVAACDASGPGLWLVAGDAPGVAIAPLEVVDRTRRVAAVSFTSAPAVRIGGLAALQRTIDAGCVLLAADAYGGARRALEMTVAYVLQREQFGQSLASFQTVKHQLADMLTEIEPTLALWWYAAHAFDRIRDQSERHAAIAKAHLTDVFDQVVRAATELHGGVGFTWEYDLQIWFRRAIFDRSYLGEASYHRARAADLAGW